MKIRFERIDDARHRLTVDHDTAVCETKSLLLHDFLHYAIEKEAGLETGFWGTLASGRTFAELRQYSNPDLAVVEKIVGALHPSTKGWSAR